MADSFISALLASLFLQSGAAGLLAGFRATGFELLAVGSAILVGRLKADGALSKKQLHGLAIAILMVALGVETIHVYNRGHRGGGFAALYAPEHPSGSGKYRGVILWTDAKTPTVLRLPQPEAARAHSQTKQTLSIPFDGVYWFFKFPDRQPPKDSYTVHGSPSTVGFQSADAVPLEMEARQNFVQPIEMSCCGRIEVDILDADRGPGTISLELILVNLKQPGEPVQRLGRRAVSSTPQLLGGGEYRPTPEVLSFDVPANPSIRQFDAARLTFVRIGGRSKSSARIAIQRFTLVPRGL